MIKTIMITSSVTACIITLLGALFISPILGAFGLAKVSIGTYQNLLATKQIVEHMRSRHVLKKRRITRKLANRSSKRVASTALAAATVGTVAVAGTVAYLEISDYCEEKAEMQADENVLYGTRIQFDLDQCLAEGQDDMKQILDEVKASASSTLSQAFRSSAAFSIEAWSELREAAEEGIRATNKAAEDLWESAVLFLQGLAGQTVDQDV